VSGNADKQPSLGLREWDFPGSLGISSLRGRQHPQENMLIRKLPSSLHRIKAEQRLKWQVRGALTSWFSLAQFHCQLDSEFHKRVRFLFMTKSLLVALTYECSAYLTQFLA
jgi:hypothetical protein